MQLYGGLGVKKVPIKAFRVCLLIQYSLETDKILLATKKKVVVIQYISTLIRDVNNRGIRL